MGETTFFLYGTLRHRALMEIVAGRPVEMVPARLEGHAIHSVRGDSFPLLAPDANAVADGVIVMLDAPTRARLDFYEGGYDYALVPMTVEAASGPVEALVYAPDPGRWQPAGAWSLDRWIRDHGALAVDAAREAMAHLGDWTPADLARRFPMIRARAWSRHLAQSGAPTDRRSDRSRDGVTVTDRRRKHTGFFALDELVADYPTFDGGRSGKVVREAFIGTDAALVLPYDPVRDRVLLVEQLRFGAYVRDDPHPWLLEPVAGLVDPGESPEATARREAMEEAGLTFRHLEPVTSGYPSPGGTTEYFHCFVGLCDLDQADATGGLDSEAEDIRSHVLQRAEAMALIGSGEANVIPLVMLLFWLEANHARLAALP